MKNLFSPKLVLILALAAVALPVAAIEYFVLRQTNRSFLYPLDDTFIHMALARNLALYGNWGMNPYEFASASSSVLYTLLLAGLFKLFSVHVIIPFIINCIAGIILLITLRRWLQKENITGGAQLVILLCVIFLTPVPILLICGMEHTLQCLFSFLFIFGFSRWLEEALAANSSAMGSPAAKPGKWHLPWPIIVYGMLVTFIRYEGLFLVGIACLILAYHRKMALAVKLGFISLLPLLIFGIYSMSKGSYFLPNSVLLKSDGLRLSFSGILRFLDNILVQKLTVVQTDSIPAGTPRPGISLLATQRLLIVLPLVYLVFGKYIRQRVAYGYILGILLACTILQLCFAATGWLYRYEAYLIYCTAAIIGVLLYKYGKEVVAQIAIGLRWIPVMRWMLAVAVFTLCFPLVLRSVAAFTKTGTACVNIYQQQYQMGRFLHTYYDQDVIAANDIGAVSFFTSGPNIDLWGLGNIKVARSRKKGYWTPDFLDSLCRENRAEAAVLYEKWFSDSLLRRWTKVATWQIRNNVICGDDTVSFFSIEKEKGPLLKKNLQEFEGRLPAGVTVRYY
jgi:hypothetical protein